MNNTLTLRLFKDEEGLTHAKVPELESDEVTDEMAVLGTALLIFLSDTKVLENYLKIAEWKLGQETGDE